jgi:hypothetical protein
MPTGARGQSREYGESANSFPRLIGKVFIPHGMPAHDIGEGEYCKDKEA